MNAARSGRLARAVNGEKIESYFRGECSRLRLQLNPVSDTIDDTVAVGGTGSMGEISVIVAREPCETSSLNVTGVLFISVSDVVATTNDRLFSYARRLLKARMENDEASTKSNG